MVLAGCAVAVPDRQDVGVRPIRETISRFLLEGRLSVKSPEQAFQARISWRHQPPDEEVIVSSPLGQALARLTSGPAGARLETSDSGVIEAPDPDSLSVKALGFALPLQGGARWVLGLPGGGGQVVALDTAGRARELLDDGWHIVYPEYESEDSDALPRRVELRREELQVRLIVDRWEVAR